MTKRKVFITGGSRGHGKALVELLEDDYVIVAPSRSELDLSKDASVDSFIKTIGSSNFDIIINNAAINNPDYIDQISDNDLYQTLHVNLISPIRLIRGFVGHMKEQKWGRIINISSIFGIVSKEKRTLYSTTKFGINGLTKALAIELGPYNILVNSVCPGFMNTDLTEKNLSKDEKQKISSMIPVGRFAEPKEVATLVRFLISEENTYITGQTLIADGGFTAL